MTDNDDFTQERDSGLPRPRPPQGDPVTEQQIDRDRLKELAENATPGPWEASWAMDEDGELTVSAGTALPDEDGLLPGSYVSTDVILEWQDVWPEDGGEQRHADAKFIAAARTAMPALLDENAELRVSLAQAEAALRRALDGEQ